MNTAYLTCQAVERVVGAHGTGTITESESDDLGEWVIVVFGKSSAHFMEAAKIRPVLTCEVEL
jgi:hypothetical protein